MDYLDAIILGMVQGLTEFLPVSSSGHLALANEFLGGTKDPGVTMEVALHLGTTFSILVVFWQEVWQLLRATPTLLHPRQWREAYETDRSFRWIVLILLSAIPVGLVGILLKDTIEAQFGNIKVVGSCLIVTGLLLMGLRCAPRGRLPITRGTALLMGFAQVLALLPGISRSGSTISAGLWCRGQREEVGRFAFLMSLPPILGAAALEARHVGEEGLAPSVALLGLLIAFLSGWVALRVLLKFLKSGHLHWFAPYCMLLGLIALAFSKA